MSSVGDVCRIENSRVHIFTCDCGKTLFWKKNAPMDTSVMRMASGFMMVVNEMPDDLRAVSSMCSPRSPKVINAASRMLSGNASGTIDRAA